MVIMYSYADSLNGPENTFNEGRGGTGFIVPKLWVEENPVWR